MIPTLSTRMITAVLAAAALPLLAEAERPKRGDHHAAHAAMLAEVDTNADGAISREEMAAHRAQKFTEIDTNKDGAASTEEMLAHHEAKRAEHRKKRGDDHHKRLDTDGNGSVTAAEFNAAPMPGFDMMDTNADGAISKQERAAAKAKIKEKRGKRGDKPPAPPAP
jgi:uncharacterized tellurite resistance protein B-like protein